MKKTSCLLLLVLLVSCKTEEPVVVTEPKLLVSTLPAFGITSSSATLRGYLQTLSSQTVAKGFYLADHPGVSDEDSMILVTGSQFSYQLVGLEPEHTYYYRAFAEKAGVRSEGEIVSFTTTEARLPVVYTGSISRITRTGALSGGHVADSGSHEVTVRGVCWSTERFPDIDDPHTLDGGGTGPFESEVTGLLPRTPYFLRAYATNATGTSYGDEQSFTTADTNLARSCPGLDSVMYAGKVYHTVLIGQKCWFRGNLNVGNMINGSFNMVAFNSNIEKYCYGNLESNCDIYGGLYQWNEMMQDIFVEGARGICPVTWHIPTREEWNEMVTLSGGINQAGTELKYNTLWLEYGNGTNRSGFAALPGGIRNLDGTFSGLGMTGIFWSSGQYGDDKAWKYILRYTDQSVVTDFEMRRMGFSVRCVKD